MKALFLSVVFLHLLILIQSVDEYEFGDIIAFPRRCPCTSITVYKHYALYVGNEFSEGDIIHRTGKPFSDNIKFGNLKDMGENYKENVPESQPIRDDIKRRIKAVLQAPDTYDLRCNNCEHLATYLRMGKADSTQPKTLVSRFCYGKKSCDEWDKLVKKMKEDEKLEEGCISSCERSQVPAG